MSKLRNQPPLGAPFNYGHPLGRGAKCSLLFNENAGRIAIDSTKYKIGPVALEGNCKFVTHHRGSCTNFDGTTACKLVLGNYTALNLQASEMSISCWVYFHSVGNYRYIVSDYNAAGTNAIFALQLTNTNKFTFFWVNAGTQAPNPLTAASIMSAQSGIWYHVVATRSGSTGTWRSNIYVNGKYENSATTGTNPNTGGRATIGQPGDYVSASLAMNGMVENVIIYDRALSESEVQMLYLDPYCMFK